MCSAAVLPSRIAKEQAPSPELFAAAPQRFFAQSPPCCSSPSADVARPRDTLGGVQRIGGKARGEVDGEGACTGEVEVEQPPRLLGREKENLMNDGDREIRGDQALIFLILGLICFL